MSGTQKALFIFTNDSPRTITSLLNLSGTHWNCKNESLDFPSLLRSSTSKLGHRRSSSFNLDVGICYPLSLQSKQHEFPIHTTLGICIWVSFPLPVALFCDFRMRMQGTLSSMIWLPKVSLEQLKMWTKGELQSQVPEQWVQPELKLWEGGPARQ